jgi:GT2 family glycosyltransferase
MTRVAVVIVNWNGARDTIDCVRSIQQMETGGAQLTIVITDNDSSDDSVASLDTFLRTQGTACPVDPPRALTDKVRRIVRYGSDDEQTSMFLVEAKTNGGFAVGNNIGVDASQLAGTPDFVWFLNSDTQADRDALLHLLAKMDANPDIGMCGSTLIHASDKRTVQSYGGSYYSLRTGRGWSPFAGQPYDPDIPDEQVERQINYVSGAAMFVRRTMLDQIGSMSEKYFLYNEEIDLSCRAAGRFRIGVAVRSVIFHQVGASIGTEGSTTSASRLSTFYQTRSKLLFAATHTRLSYPLVWLTLLARALKFYRMPTRRAEAWVIVQVLAGRRTVDPQWFTERRMESQKVSEERP